MLVVAIVTGIVVAIKKFALHRKIAAIFTASMLLLCVSTAVADEPQGRRITARISCPEEGVLYAFLVDEDMFDRPMEGLQKRVSRVAEKGVVTIAFKDVPPGTYGVRCFLDTNGNGKLDRGLFGPTEPWGMSFRGGRPQRWPRWNEMKFTLSTEDKTVRITMPK